MLIMKKSTKINIAKHITVIIFFIITAVLFFSPVLKGKKILQNDIVQYSGMSKELKDYRSNYEKETYWVNNAFSGMPTYQLGAKYPHNYIKKLDLLIRFLPRPADYLFLYFIGFYFLMLSLKIEYRLAVLGALSFGFSTYLIIIIGAGHNAKAHAISYMPFVLGSIIYVVRKKYIIGFILTAIFLGLQLTANHFQMTYYLMFIVIVMAIWFVVKCIKENDRVHLIKTIVVLFTSLVFSLLMNSSNILTTMEYSKESTRGNSSSLTINSDGSPKENFSKGLDREYITQWSYGVFESLNLFIPKIVGGGSSEKLDSNSSFYQILRKSGYSPLESNQIVKNSPTYWGNQPFVEAPAYVGIAVFFLFVFSVFLYRGNHRSWLLASIILSLLLSFGKNFSFLTDLFISYFPIYDKFRAVSSIQVILELCIPIMAILGLSSLFSDKIMTKSKIRALNFTGMVFLLILIVLYLIKGFLPFSGISDQYMDETIVEALIEDRKEIYVSQLLKSFIFISIIFSLIFLFIKEKLKKNYFIVSLAIIISTDLILFSKNYVNDENFVDAVNVENPYNLDEVYKSIIDDKSDYRVLDLTENSTKPNYFFNSINGYHAAKLGRYNDVMDFYLNKNHLNTLSMLNTKYIIFNQEGEKQIFKNEFSSGSAWFVKENINVFDDDQEIKSLDTLNYKEISVSQSFESKKYYNNTSSIVVAEKKSDYIRYDVSSDDTGLIIFSEIFYPKGWKAYINDQEVTMERFNYILRGLEVPKGKHRLEFVFDPTIVKLSSNISLFSTLGFVFIILVMILKRKN
ncbi:MAG: YfhO family protein [Bacteroidota bacterium]|nr:YfhO family protein [Bacteroidota bacterium]GIR21046.1 MAG: membrane protein [Flavobacteriales bacterium]